MALRFAPARGASILISSSSRGPSGAAATIAVGTTTTGAAGASASVANSGSSSAATFDFTIPRGADAGFKYTFDTSTDTTTTPSSGGVKFNNATPASITEIAIHATDADGNTARPTILTYDDSSSAAKGKLAFKRYDGVQIVLNVAGSFTDNATWLKLTVTHSSGTTLFAASDKVYLSPQVTGDAGIGNVSATSTFGTDNLLIRSDGTSRNLQSSNVVVDDTGSVYPSTGTTATLGTTSAPWASLSLGNAGAVNFNNGDVTITHSTNSLSFAGSTSYVFDAKIAPATNNAVPLGDTTHAYSALYLGNAGLIDFNAGDVTITHSTNALTFAGSTGYVFDNKIAPSADDGAALGDLTHGFSDLFLADGGVINFSGDITITHSTAALSIAGGPTALATNSTVNSAKIVTVGKNTIYVPAAAMASAQTNGAESATFVTSTNAANIKTLAFDTATAEYAHFNVAMPKNWDEGVVTYQATWFTTLASTDGVAWGLEAVSISDNDPLDVAWGTQVVVTDQAQSQANELYVTVESTSVTSAGTPAAGDTTFFRLSRVVGNATDVLATDARLVGIRLHYNTDAPTDA